METNFNLGSLKIVYVPLMEYFKNIQENVTKNVVTIKDDKKIVINYDFIKDFKSLQSPLKMIGLLGIVKILEMIKKSIEQLKEGKFDNEKSVLIWQLNQELLKEIDNYLKSLLNGALDEPIKLFKNYKQLSVLIDENVTIKDLFFPKLQLIKQESNLEKELKVGSSINNTDKLNIIKTNQNLIQQYLVTLFASISQNESGVFNSVEDKNAHHNVCKKLYSVLTQLQEEKISTSHYIMFGIQKLLICSATPVFNDNFSYLIKNYSKELKFNLAKIDKTIKNLIDDIDKLNPGDKTGILKVDDSIIKENLLFTIELIKENVALRNMPVFNELIQYFDYDFYVGQLAEQNINESIMYSKDIVLYELEKLLIEMKEELSLFSEKSNDKKEFSEINFNNFLKKNKLLLNVIPLSEKSFNVLSTVLNNVGDKILNKEIVFNDEVQKELATTIVLMEYAINVLEKNYKKEDKDNFNTQLDLQKTRLQYLLDGKSLTLLELPILDSKNKAEDENNALVKVFFEINQDFKQAEEIFDTVLTSQEIDKNDFIVAIKSLNRVKGTLAIVDHKELSNITKEIVNIWEQIEKIGIKSSSPILLENSINWIGALSLILSSYANNNASDGKEIEEKLIEQYNNTLLGDNDTLEKVIPTSFNEVKSDDSNLILSPLELIEPLFSQEKEVSILVDAEDIKVDPQILEIQEMVENSNDVKDENLDEEILQVFLEEFKIVNISIEHSIALLEKNSDSKDELLNLRRQFHTVKGSGKMVGLHDLGDLAWVIEQSLNKIIDTKINLSNNAFLAMKKIIKQFIMWEKELETTNNIVIDLTKEKEMFLSLFNTEDEIVVSEDKDLNTMLIKEMVIIHNKEIDKQLYDLFMKESTQHIKDLNNVIDELVNKGNNVLSYEFMQHNHTLSSIAYTVNLLNLSSITKKLEILSNISIENNKIVNNKDLKVIKDIIERFYQYRNINIMNPSVFENDINNVDMIINNLSNKQEEEMENKEVINDISMDSLLIPEVKVDDLIIDEEYLMNLPQDVSEIPVETIIPNIEESKANESMPTEKDNIEMKESISSFNANVDFLKEYLKNVTLNNASSKDDISNEEIFNKMLQKMDVLLEEKYTELIERFEKNEILHQEEKSELTLKIISLEKRNEEFIESQSRIERNQKEGVELVRKDLRSLAHILKKKSSESYQDVLEYEIIQEHDSLGIDSQKLIQLDHENSISNGLFPKDNYINTIFAEKISSIVDEIDEEIYNISIMEVEDIFIKIEAILENISDIENIEEKETLKRYLHTFKGSVRMAGANKMGTIAHRLETLLEYSENHHIALLSIKPLIELEMSKLHFLEENRNVELTKNKADWLDNIESSINDSIGIQETIINEVVKEQLPEKYYIRIVTSALDSLINEAGEIRLSRTTLEGILNNNKKTLIDLKTSSEKLNKILKEVDLQAQLQISARKDELIEKGQSFDPLEFDNFSRLQELTHFMTEAVTDIKDAVTVIETFQRSEENAIAQQSIVTNNMLSSLMKIRLIPFNSISDRLYNLTRKTAKEMQKHVSLELTGEKTEMDRLVLERIQSPLDHILRNCIAHGIESPEVRNENNKPSIGKIKINLRQDGNFITIKISDDGNGMNINKIKKIGYEKGLLKENIDYTQSEIVDLIFKSGFSTVDVVSQLAGRGVGMDVVKKEISSLGGSIRIDTKEREGSIFTIVLPVAVATNQAILTEVDDKLIAIPAILVEQVLSLKKIALEEAYKERKVTYKDVTYPLYYLGHLTGSLDNEEIPEIKTYNTLILVSYLEQNIIVHVDKLETTDEILIKPMGPIFGKITGILGATLLGDGRQGMVINPLLLMEHVGKNIKKAEKNTKNKGNLTIMVVDDSITIRRATFKILEKYGYNILLAKDGQDALQQLQITIPDIILSDIEMPIMDGFELLKNLKSNSKYKSIPVIMITSRTADKHKQFAYSLGVDGFLGKPYQELELINNIIKLTQ